MLERHRTVAAVLETGVVAIVRVMDAREARPVVDACLAGGINTVEVTFSVPKAHRVIEELSGLETGCILGAGTVCDAPTARIAILSGARYIVSPAFDVETAKLCNRYAIPYLPGCYTPAEVLHALDYGVDIIKLFPGSGRSPSILKAYRGPIPQANFMPTGGVSLSNAADWIKAGAVALGVGGDLTAEIKDGDYSGVSAKAKAYVQAVREARNGG